MKRVEPFICIGSDENNDKGFWDYRNQRQDDNRLYAERNFRTGREPMRVDWDN